MRKYQQWQDAQSYFLHLSQLNQIRIRKPTEYSPQRIRIRRKRAPLPDASQHSTDQKAVDKVDKQFLPLTLIPKDAREALKNTLRLQSKMQLKDKQIILQNYLIGQRILKTLPVISKKAQDKEYSIYRRVLKNMSRVNPAERSIRSQKHLSYRSESSKEQPVGSGKNILVLKINKMTFMKHKIDNQPDNLMVVKLRLGNRTISSHLYSPDEITLNQMVFAFRKRDVTLSPCQVKLNWIHKIEVTELGVFKVHLLEAVQSGKGIQKQKIVEAVLKQGIVCGTIEYTMSLTKKVNQI